MAHSRHTNLTRLIKLAHKVREEVETHASHHYPPDSLRGGCGTTSFKLMKEARSNGIKVRMVYGLYYSTVKQKKKSDGHNHWWIEYDDRIIDATATQFGLVPFSEKVVVCSAKSAHYEKRKQIRIIEDAWDSIETWAIVPKALRKNCLRV